MRLPSVYELSSVFEGTDKGWHSFQTCEKTQLWVLRIQPWWKQWNAAVQGLPITWIGLYLQCLFILWVDNNKPSSSPWSLRLLAGEVEDKICVLEVHICHLLFKHVPEFTAKPSFVLHWKAFTALQSVKGCLEESVFLASKGVIIFLSQSTYCSGNTELSGIF